MKRFMLPPVIAHALAWAAFFGVVFCPWHPPGHPDQHRQMSCE